MTISDTLFASPKQAMDLLWARVRQRGDLPGFSSAVRAILGAMRGEDDREFSMTKTVLSDPALTQKVLRLANSPMYAVFGGQINTVSKAVIVLGTEAIGHLALGLKLIDGLSDVSDDSENTRAQMEKALLAGQIARYVASSASTRDTEEAVVCSMLHSLGRMMVAFYLADYWLAIQTRCSGDGLAEADAVRAVLGMQLDEIGRLIAQHWGLPASLVNSLQDMLPQKVSEPLDHADWLAAVSTMATSCANVLHHNNSSTMEAISIIANDYAEMLGLEVSQVLTAIDAVQANTQEEAVLIRPAREIDMRKNAPASAGKPDDTLNILANGIHDMREALQRISAAQLMSMALETVYKGFGFSRAIAFLRNQETAKYIAHMCFGEGAQEILPHLAFGDAYQPDVFHAALANDKMIFVENAQDQKFINKLPRWWKEQFPTSRSFIVLPLSINQQPMGFIYGDWDQHLFPSKIEAAEILSLNELRALVMQAYERWQHACNGAKVKGR